MADGETHADVTGQPGPGSATSGPASLGGDAPRGSGSKPGPKPGPERTLSETETLRFFRCTRFGDVVGLTGSFALMKEGCRGLEITTPGGRVVPLSWTSKSGGVFEPGGDTGAVAAAPAEALRRRIYPDAVLLIFLDAAGWPEDAPGGLSLRGFDADGAALFRTDLPVTAAEVLLGTPVGMTISVAVAGQARGSEALDPRDFDLRHEGRPLALRPVAAPDCGFELLEARLPTRVYDGQKHRFELFGASGALLAKQAKTMAEMHHLAQVAPQIAERPRLSAIPPADVALALEYMQSDWRLASDPDLGAGSVPALARRRRPQGQVALYVFAPSLEAALATPAIAGLSQSQGADLAPHIVLPTPEAVAFGVAVQANDRVDQLLPLITPGDLLGRIQAQAPGSAVVLLPAGAALEPAADSLIDAVRAGQGFGHLARVALQADLGALQLRVAEVPDAAPLAAGAMMGAQMGPGRLGDLAAILSQRAALRMLRPTSGTYGGLRLSTLELQGPVAAPFAAQSLSSAAVTLPEIPLCLVIEGLPQRWGRQAIDSYAKALRALETAGCRVVQACLHSENKALPDKSPLRRVETLCAATPEDLETVRRVGPLLPDHKAYLFFGAAEMLALTQALEADMLVQALRMAAAMTEVSADVVFQSGPVRPDTPTSDRAASDRRPPASSFGWLTQSLGASPVGETAIRGLCTIHRARLS